MLTEQQINFLKDHPMIRQILYRSARIDQDRANEAFKFLQEAYRRQFPVVMTFEVQGVSVSMNLTFDAGGPGWHLYNYVAPWIASMALKDGGIAEQMAVLWPDLELTDILPRGGTGPEVAPESP